ncbi:FUSC family protein [Paraburkholderia sp. J63]|uniref:FUSC family protein n=1 Tax=Paraburkholderia sp. J63 TaxID=2805434 RepID=UPI002ABD9580|nr:FUSC family protein [Paraburkholderia sp. J63]
MTTPPAAAFGNLKNTTAVVRLFGRTEGPILIHVLKTLLAVIAATGISMRLELVAPRTAMVTVVILMMHRQSGMVMARGFYRGLGMLAGNLAALVLIALFPQERVLFLVALSLWIGLCVWGAAYYRNYQSYGFVLAGYATCITALPAIDHPYAIFDNVVTSLSEVSIGILCASLVSALILPQKVRDMLLRTGEKHFAGFILFVRSTLTMDLSSDELGRTHLRLVAERAQLENLRSAAVFEDPALRAHNDAMIRLAGRFLDAGARFHSLHQFRHCLRAIGDPQATAAVDRLCAAFAMLIPDSDESPAAELSQSKLFAGNLDKWTDEFTQTCDANRLVVRGAGPQSLQYFDSGAAQLEEAVTSLRLYLTDFIAIRQLYTAPTRASVEQPVRIVTTANRMVSAAAGGRAILAIAVVSLFWIASGWTGATSAVISATIASALYSVMPAPAQATRQMVAGCLLSWLASLLFNFYLLPRLDGFAALAAAIAPFIIFGSYLNSFPKTATIGLGFNIYFCFLSNLTNPSVYAPTITFDAGFSTMLGIGVASLAYSIVAPYGGDWVTGLYLRQLRRLVAKDACYGRLSGLMLRFDSGVRDFMQQIAIRPPAGRLGQGELLAWSFASMEIGRNLIELRETAQAAALPSTWPAAETTLRTAISAAFSAPSKRVVQDAVRAIGHALAVLDGINEIDKKPNVETKFLVRMRASLNFIRLSFLDRLLPLDLDGSVSDR